MWCSYAILYRKPYQHALQLATSLGQLYGDVLYLSTAYFAKEEFAVPGVIYFWGYFIFMNAIWVVVPILTAMRSWTKICKAQATSTDVSKKTEWQGLSCCCSRRAPCSLLSRSSASSMTILQIKEALCKTVDILMIGSIAFGSGEKRIWSCMCRGDALLSRARVSVKYCPITHVIWTF